MNLSYRVFAIKPYAPDQFESFYVVASQLEEAESHVDSLWVRSFIIEELVGVSGTQLIV